MFVRSLYAKLFGVLVLCLAAAPAASGQIILERDPADLEDNVYRVRIDSTVVGSRHTLGIFGRPSDSVMRIYFDGGRTGPDITTRRLNGGMRLVCVWDPRGNILFYDSVLIDRNGTLRIPYVFRGGAARAGGAARGEAGGSRAMRGLRIEDD